MYLYKSLLARQDPIRAKSSFVFTSG